MVTTSHSSANLFRRQLMVDTLVEAVEQGDVQQVVESLETVVPADIDSDRTFVFLCIMV